MRETGKKMKHNAERGFTTLELSMVIMIFGTVMSTFLYGLQSYYKYEKKQETKSSLSATELAIVSFRNMYGRYPCPAPRNLPPTSPTAGREVCYGQTVLGRDTNADGQGDHIFIGAIPYKTLMDPDNNPSTEDGVAYSLDAAFDGWDNKLTYAVTSSMTSAETYKADAGAISVKDEFGKNLLQEEGSAPFVILSHGKDGLGGYSRSGAQVSDCTNSVASDPGAGEEDTVKKEEDPKRVDLADKAVTFYIPDITDSYGDVSDNDELVTAISDYMIGRVDPIMAQPEHSAYLSGVILGGLIENGVLTPDQAAAVNDRLVDAGAYPYEEGKDVVTGLPQSQDADGDGKKDEEPTQTAGNMTPQIDNCNMDGSFTVSLYSEADNTYFDDLVKFGHPASPQHWRPLDENRIVNANIGNVGINEEAPTQKLQVKGTISAISVELEKICDRNGENCLSPALLAGRSRNNLCGPGQAVRGIENGQIVCETINWSAVNIACTDPATYMTGLSNKTGAICAPRS